jgi:teichoic acid transport system permease protein
VVTDSTRASNLYQAAVNYLFTLWDRREFAWYLAMGNLKSRNASTALGLFWWVLNPLLQGAVYYIVFGVILGVSRDLSHLLIGIFVFTFTATSITTGANAIIQNTKLLVNLQFPRLILPIMAVIETGIGFLVSIPALFLIIGFSDGYWPTVSFFLIFPVIFALQAIFNLGLAALTARVAVPFRDITNVIPHLTRIWLYLSPILFTVDQYENLPDTAQRLAELNPMVSFLAVYRGAIMGTDFVVSDLTTAAAWAFSVCAIAVFVFIRYEGKMARYL